MNSFGLPLNASRHGLVRPLSFLLVLGQTPGALGLGGSDAAPIGPLQENSSFEEHAALSATRNFTIPFHLVRGFLIQVEGSIGSLTGLKFVLDTGTTRSMLDARLADKLSLPRQDGTVLNFDRPMKIAWTTVPDLQIGPLQAHNLRIMVASMSEVTEFASESMRS